MNNLITALTYMNNKTSNIRRRTYVSLCGYYGPIFAGVCYNWQCHKNLRHFYMSMDKLVLYDQWREQIISAIFSDVGTRVVRASSRAIYVLENYIHIE